LATAPAWLLSRFDHDVRIENFPNIRERYAIDVFERPVRDANQAGARFTQAV
jgi:hypothetical protein